MLPRSRYPDDLTDEEWLLISRLVRLRPSSTGRKGRYSKRERLNALFYLLRTGCSRRHLPHDFLPWKSVYTQFRRWKRQGVIELLMQGVKGELRRALGRLGPTVGTIDSQSVKMTEKGGSKDTMGRRK